MNVLTDEDIHKIGQRARANYDTSIGECRSIALDVHSIAADEYDVHMEVVETQVGEVRDTHFVNKLSEDEYENDVADPVLVDAALDQFCTENQHHDKVRVDFGRREWLPEVAIFPPRSEERYVWYYTPNDPREGYDVFMNEPLRL